MTAELRGVAESCGSCGASLPAGTTLYLVTAKRLIRCGDCARTILPELPEVVLTNIGPSPELARRSSLHDKPIRMFDPKKMAAHLFDWRAKQAGE
jgi:hypothetical protein